MQSFEQTAQDLGIERREYRGRLDSVVYRLQQRYSHAGNLNDLREAFKFAQQAKELTPRDDPAIHIRLHNLAVLHLREYERTSRGVELDEAIKYSRQAIKLTPERDPNLAEGVNVLGCILAARFGLTTGRAEDLNEAIKASERAVELSPNTLIRAQSLYNLGLRYQKRSLGMGLVAADDFENLRKDLEWKKIVEKLGKLKEGTEEGEFEEMRKIIEASEKDLEKAIKASRCAIELADAFNGTAAAGYRNSLANQLEILHMRTPEREELLEEAILLSKGAINLLPSNHPNRGSILGDLANKLLRSQTRRLEALPFYREAWVNETALPSARIMSATSALKLLMEIGDYPEAYQLSVDAIDLLPRVHSRSLTLSSQDQQHIVRQFSGLATDACSLALQLGLSPERAIELLERGRGVILGLLINDRSDLAELEAKHPKLYQTYDKLRSKVNTNVDNKAYPREYKRADERREALKKLDEHVQKIRRLPDFGQFEKTLTVEQMRQCAAKGNIVIINITNLRSDAIIVSLTGIKAIHLPKLDAKETRHLIKQWQTSKNDEKNGNLEDFLKWLWDSCVKLVLDHLHYTPQDPAEKLPRIWWIGTGLASSFPFHAAGPPIKKNLPKDSAYDRVISSYIPSIKALKYARNPIISTKTLDKNLSKAVIITMKTTPGWRDLQQVNEESTAVETSGDFESVQTLRQPDVKTVLELLRTHSIAHFSCHGTSDQFDPAESGLLLQKVDGATSEPSVDILSVLKVSQAHLSEARIAYLSACSTAQNRIVGLEDEVLHIVSGFQVAGFRSVIGCLWPAEDEVCPQIARLFYSKLAGNRDADDRDRLVALALHQAAVQVRRDKRYRKLPMYWAPYVYYGA
ncbi:CHAT domain-containing protein [Leptodontidium sp. 2 PMI_412]|nr:CHAT domain-containing protein [Leptodontidium sp. 2 PMI_412]